MSILSKILAFKSDPRNHVTRRHASIGSALLLFLGCWCFTAYGDLYKRPTDDASWTMVYDSDLNITWRADGNRSNHYSWFSATTWANNLVFGGFDDWRLPSAVDINSGEVCSGRVDSANPCIGEMGYLFLQLGGTTGNPPLDDLLPTGSSEGDWVYNTDWNSFNTGPAGDPQPPSTGVYWLKEERTGLPPGIRQAAIFRWGNQRQFGENDAGLQATSLNAFQGQHHAWAVRDGDVIDSFAVDVKPTSCENPLNVKSKVLPVAIAGSNNLDVAQIDVASVRLNDVSPVRSAIEDVTHIFYPPDCYNFGADGYYDLTLKFSAQEVVATLGDVADGDIVKLTLTGKLTGTGNPTILGHDTVLIKKKGK